MEWWQEGGAWRYEILEMAAAMTGNGIMIIGVGKALKFYPTVRATTASGRITIRTAMASTPGQTASATTANGAMAKGAAKAV